MDPSVTISSENNKHLRFDAYFEHLSTYCKVGKSTSSRYTQVVNGVTSLVQSSRVELEADDGEDEDGEHDEEADLHQRGQRLQDGLQHNLQTWDEVVTTQNVQL